MDTILRNIQRKPGAVFTSKDFLQLSGREAVDQTLSRLAKAGLIVRLGRGLYSRPRFNRTLGIQVPPDVDQIAAALARQTGCRIAFSGALAANRLGLSTQVPSQPVYLCDGRSRQVKVGNYVIVLKHAGPKDFPKDARVGALSAVNTHTTVLQALKYLGKDAANDEVVSKMQSLLSPEEKRKLLNASSYMTDWIAKAAKMIVQDTCQESLNG